MTHRIAVTGANGFVGGHLVRHAVDRGLEVVGLVRSEAAARQVAEAGGRPAIVTEQGPEAYARALEDCGALVHLAQIGSERPGASYEAVNVGGTVRAIEGARAAGVPRLVYFSGLGVARYGLAPRCTNPYFLSKLAAEVAHYRSDREVVVFRPSYVVGPGDAFVQALLADMAKGQVEQPGDGSYRLQPIAVQDAAALVLAAISRAPSPKPAVFDLVGPEPLSFAAFVERLGAVARAQGLPADFRVRSVPIAEVDRQARAGGYRGMQSDALDCLLCDEVSDPGPLRALLGRPLTPLDDAVAAAVRAAPASGGV
jgi:nucleoside-diphosphate-sugar epimerase